MDISTAEENQKLVDEMIAALVDVPGLFEEFDRQYTRRRDVLRQKWKSSGTEAKTSDVSFEVHMSTDPTLDGAKPTPHSSRNPKGKRDSGVLAEDDPRLKSVPCR